MKRNKYTRLFAAIISVLILLSALSGCQNGKKFESSESMIAAMVGCYSGTNEHSSERVIIDANRVIKFNIDKVFPEITDVDLFWENFPNENWEELDLATLLEKPYINIVTEPISTNVKKSTIAGMLVNKDGVLVSQAGSPLIKTSSDPAYPTAEMQEKFAEYVKYLQEHEKAFIIAEAESELESKQDSINSAISSAKKPSTSKKSTASAETIGECAFESLKDYMKFPLTATLDSYNTNPQYDDYGRVITSIVVTSQNSFGNYITKKYYVVLQSCTSYGYFTYKDGMHYTDNENYTTFLMSANDFTQDPDADYSKEGPYEEAIQLVEDKAYTQAISKLNTLGDYKSSAKLKDACIDYLNAEKYKKAADLFADEKYSEAKKELSSLLNDNKDGYLKAERIITLCNEKIGDAPNNDSNSNNGGTANNSTNKTAAYKQIFNGTGIDYDVSFPGVDTVCYAYKDEDGRIFCTALGFEGNIANYTTDTIYLPLSLFSEDELKNLERDYRDVFSGWEELPFCTMDGKTGTDYFTITVTLSDLDKVENYNAMYEAGVTNENEPLYLDENEAYYLGEGYIKIYDTRTGSDNTNSNTSNGGNTTQTPTQKPTQTPAQKPTQTPTQKPTQAPCSHTYKDATCTAPKTCTKCGATSGSALPHTWKDATCTEPETCTVCGATDTPALGHNYSAATCITPATCSDCGATSGDVAKHRWKDATCTAPATCTVCKKTSGRARGHIMDGTVCEECNYTDFSAFAGTFSELADVGHECFEAGCMPSKVSLSKDGVLSFTFEGEAYSVTLEQDRSDLDFLPDEARFYFDSYPNGVADEEEFLSTYITIDKDSMEFTITFYWPFFCFYDEDRDIYIEDLSFDVVGTLDVLPYTE